jgi:signal transduction histidine kinase
VLQAAGFTTIRCMPNRSHMVHANLRLRFIASLVALLCVLFMVLGFVLIRQNTSSLRLSLNEKSIAFAELATKPIGDSFVLYQDSGRIKITEQTKRFYELNPDIVSVAVIDTSGKVQYKYGDESRTTIQSSMREGFTSDKQYDSEGFITQIIQPYVEDFGGYRYALVYTISTAKAEKQITQISIAIIMLGLLFVVASTLLSYIVLNRLFIRPVREISRLANIVSAGNLNQQIVMSRADEIGDLARSVNKMSNTLKADIVKLQDADKLKSEFMMIVSHNLRTPLTVMKGYIEAAETMKMTNELRALFMNINASTIRLSEFAEDVLAVATIEAGGLDAEIEAIVAKPALSKILNEFSILAKQKQIEVKNELIIQEEKIRINVPHLRSVLWNLLDNAYKFTNAGGKILVKAYVHEESIIIEVIDNGIGIEANELPKLFTKFHRATSALQYDFEGIGIGLYLTKLILGVYHGTITVESTKGKGSCFKVKLPLAE